MSYSMRSRCFHVAILFGFGVVCATDPARAQVRRLNGIYVASDGSRLLVEAVPVNRGEKITLIVADTELSVERKDPGKPFVYRHDACELVILPYLVGRKQAMSIEAFGTCTGMDKPFDGLNISYTRS
jgi:hypothetical protein